MERITAGQAIAKVLHSWNITHLYGIPGSSVNGLMDGLYQEKEHIKYIQVRHESAGAMAASADAKLTGKIGVAFGSGGPGGTNLMNGLYDAKMDNVPVLALVGQVPTEYINTTYFQELNQLPIYSDVAVYNKQVVTAQQIPDVIEEAIRTAYKEKGVAVVILPNDLLEEEILFVPRKEPKVLPTEVIPTIDTNDFMHSLELIKEAKRPILYVGMGLKGAMEEVMAVSNQLNLPVVSSALSIGTAVPSDFDNYLGSFGRLGTKPAYEALQAADLIMFIGSNMPFARFWPKGAKVIQVNNNLSDIGKQLSVDIGILGDGKEYLEKLFETGLKKEPTSFLIASRRNKKNWDEWLNQVAKDERDGLPAEAVFKEISEYAKDDALYGLDVGNNAMHSVRMLPLTGKQQYALSAWFATMGYGLPSSMAAHLSYPTRQVWSISGDGGFSMNMQEIVTQVKYNMPIINIVISNQSYGFIQHAQILSDFMYGVDLQDADWAMAAKGMGAITFSVSTIEELRTAFKEIEVLQKGGNQVPILLDAKVNYKDPFDTSFIILDPDEFSEEAITSYKKQYNIFGMPALSELMKEK